MKTKILVICALDSTAWVLLRYGLTALQTAGYDVHIAASPGQHVERLNHAGFRFHAVDLRRSFSPLAHVKPLFQLWRLIRTGTFAIVNAQTGAAGLIGRLAAWLAGCRAIVYTVHGFIFHENMPAYKRFLIGVIEYLTGQITDYFIFVSDEDHRTAIETGIKPSRAGAMTSFNGVDPQMFHPRGTDPGAIKALRMRLSIADDVPVIGIIGRIVREKGHREFLEMARRIAENRKAIFLVVGDTLPSDRDQFGRLFRKQVKASGMSIHFRFTGQVDEVADYIRLMDLFVLPSYREGFPVSILEAMSCGVPVIATRIRGCRESVVDGETGILVNPRDSTDLFHAVDRLLRHPEEAARMGQAGRERVLRNYTHAIVQAKVVRFMDEICDSTGVPAPAASN